MHENSELLLLCFKAEVKNGNHKCIHVEAPWELGAGNKEEGPENKEGIRPQHET